MRKPSRARFFGLGEVAFVFVLCSGYSRSVTDQRGDDSTRTLILDPAVMEQLWDERYADGGTSVVRRTEWCTSGRRSVKLKPARAVIRRLWREPMRCGLRVRAGKVHGALDVEPGIAAGQARGRFWELRLSRVAARAWRRQATREGGSTSSALYPPYALLRTTALSGRCSMPCGAGWHCSCTTLSLAASPAGQAMDQGDTHAGSPGHDHGGPGDDQAASGHAVWSRGSGGCRGRTVVQSRVCRTMPGGSRHERAPQGSRSAAPGTLPRTSFLAPTQVGARTR